MARQYDGFGVVFVMPAFRDDQDIGVGKEMRHRLRVSNNGIGGDRCPVGNVCPRESGCIKACRRTVAAAVLHRPRRCARHQFVTDHVFGGELHLRHALDTGEQLRGFSQP